MTREKAVDAVGRKPLSMGVVIPTRNRIETLRRTVEALAEQAEQGVVAEVVVVDDGSTDGTFEWLAQHRQDYPFALEARRLAEHGGPARARNAGIRAGSADIVLFLGDDTVPAPGLLQRHSLWHERHSDPAEALLGRVTWSPEIEVTPFMRWLERDGQAYYFNYAAMGTDAAIPSSFFYTCNVSVKRAFLLRTSLFDESFPYASHEDLELGHRLGVQGMRLWYDPQALAWHWHALDTTGMCRRVYRMGYSAPWYWRKVGVAGPAWRRASRRVLAFLCGLRSVRRLGAAICSGGTGDDGKPRTMSWHVALGISFWAGMGDNLRGVSPAD